MNNNSKKNSLICWFSIITIFSVFFASIGLVKAKDQRVVFLKHPPLTNKLNTLPSPVEFRETQQRGLQIKTWVNNVGPFIFVIDTGSGITLISRKVAAQAKVLHCDNKIELQGASQQSSIIGDQVKLDKIAIGGIDNLLPNQGRVAVVDTLPADIDGVLDPTEAFQPLGYTIDFPNSQISAFDSRIQSLRNKQSSKDTAIVAWSREDQGHRPFVLLNNKVEALIDSGSRFGLALSYTLAKKLDIDISNSQNQNTQTIYDLNGQSFSVYRAKPSTIWLDSMVLNKIPTDVIENISDKTPILLGRDALRPFKITFDPRSRLIEFLPVKKNSL